MTMTDVDSGYTGQTDDADDSDLVKKLRREIKRRDDELSAYRNKERETVFREAGFDPESWIGRKLAEDYQGEMNAEKIREYAEQHGIGVPAAQEQEQAGASQERVETAARIDGLRAQGTPVGAAKVGWDDFKKMLVANPGEATRLYNEGRVERPDTIAQFAPSESV